MIVFHNIAFFIPLLPALIALLYWKYRSPTQKVFAGMLWTIIAISFVGRLWNIFITPNNMPFFHSYVLVECLFLLFIFSQFYQSDWKKPIWLILGGLFVAAWMVNIAVISSIWTYPDTILALEALIVLVLVMGFFRKMLKEKRIRRPTKTFEFWVCSGLLVFFSGNFLIFVFSNFLKHLDMTVFQAIWMVNSVLVILLYLMYTIGLLCTPKMIK